MRHPSRALALAAALGAGPLLLAAGCGSAETGARSTLVSIQETSYVLKDPVTTTTISTVPPSVADGRSPSAQTYTVRANDSVFKIARAFDVDPEVLANYNKWSEGVQHPLFVGDVIQIPPDAVVPGETPSEPDPPAPDEDETPDEAPSDGCEHTVVSGDNPTRVARKYDITVDQLQAANANNPAYQTFLIGSKLTIPPGGSC